VQRTDLLDTAPWAHRAMVLRLREMTPEQRLAIAIDASELGLAMDRLARQRLAETDSQCRPTHEDAP